MGEGEAFGMEVEPIGGMAVKRVAHDGAAQPFGMRRMHAQLMCPACVGIECDACATSLPT